MAKSEGGIDDYLEERRKELERLGARLGPTTTTPAIAPGSVKRKVSIGAQGRRLQLGVGGTASRRHANSSKKK